MDHHKRGSDGRCGQVSQRSIFLPYDTLDPNKGRVHPHDKEPHPPRDHAFLVSLTLVTQNSYNLIFYTNYIQPIKQIAVIILHNHVLLMPRGTNYFQIILEHH